MRNLQARRRVHRVLWMVGLGLALALLNGCDKNGETGDGGPPKEGGPGTPDLPPAPEGVSFKKAGDSVEVDFSKAPQYLVVPYSVSEVTAAAIAYTITVKSAAGSSSGSFALRPHRAPMVVDPVVWARLQQRLQVEKWLRSIAEEAVRKHHSPPMVPIAGANCTVSADCEATEVCNAGTCASTLTIKTEKFSATKTITATVKKRGKVAAVLVDNADAAVTQGTIDSILKRFDETIQPRSVSLFGDPPLKDGAKTTASDRNADGIVWLVLTSKVQEKKAVGFFVATDFTDEAASNKADILYIDAAAQANAAYGILAHEYQHLLNYGAKKYRADVAKPGSGTLEDIWLDEGEAHFAEDACGFGGENTTMLRQSTFPDFSDKSLTVTNPADDDLSMRGMAFLFVRYLFEQKGGVSYKSDGGIEDKGGAAVLKALHLTASKGVTAVNEVCKPTFGDFKSVFDNWMTAVSIDGRGFYADYPRYVYAPLLPDPVTSNEIGVKIRGARKDETGTAVKLEGPTETDLAAGDTEDKVPNASGKLFLLKQTGKVTVTVKSPDPSIRYLVIRLGK